LLAAIAPDRGTARPTHHAAGVGELAADRLDIGGARGDGRRDLSVASDVDAVEARGGDSERLAIDVHFAVGIDGRDGVVDDRESPPSHGATVHVAAPVLSADDTCSGALAVVRVGLAVAAAD
jgi:hypothetical protein